MPVLLAPLVANGVAAGVAQGLAVGGAAVGLTVLAPRIPGPSGGVSLTPALPRLPDASLVFQSAEVAGAALAGFLSGLWGFFNWKPPFVAGEVTNGTFSPAGSGGLSFDRGSTWSQGVRKVCSTGAVVAAGSSGSDNYGNFSNASARSIRIVKSNFTRTNVCISSGADTGGVTTQTYIIEVLDGAGAVIVTLQQDVLDGRSSQFVRDPQYNQKLTISNVQRGGVPVTLFPATRPFAPPVVVTVQEAEEPKALAPAPVAPPLPAVPGVPAPVPVEPAEPGVEPVPEEPKAPPLTFPSPAPGPAPGTSPGPGPAPRPVPPGPGPFPVPIVPGPVPKPPAVLPPAPPVVAPPVPVTPPGQEVTPDGPIGSPGQAPQPTLEGIAQEVGKIEQKCLQLLNRPQPEGFDPDVLEILGQILGFFTSIYGPGSYQIQGPCELDPEGNVPEPLEASWPGGVGGFGEIVGKLDALAQLVQHHKDLKQPVCKARPFSGQEVTVLFEEEV